MADQAVQPGLECLFKGRSLSRGQGLDLGEAVGETVGDLHVSALECAEQLLLMVAHHAQARPAIDHVADDPQRVEHARPAIDEVADEHGLPAIRVAVDRPGVETNTIHALGHAVAEHREE